MLEAWAEDADGGVLGALLQRYGAEPPSQALLTCLGSRADYAAEELVTLALAGAALPAEPASATSFPCNYEQSPCLTWTAQTCTV